MLQRLHHASFRLVGGTCVLCAARTRRSRDLCADCEADLPPPPPGHTSLAPVWRITAAFAYESPVDRLILDFKSGGRLLIGQVLASVLSSRVALLPNPPDLLIPVPLHPLRRAERGFNQAEEIANVIAAVAGVPVAADACTRLKRARDQKTLGLAGRERNVSGVFAARPMPGCRVAIVDDVITTGATICELARCCIDAGAQSVEAIAVARTP